MDDSQRDLRAPLAAGAMALAVGLIAVALWSDAGDGESSAVQAFATASDSPTPSPSATSTSTTTPSPTTTSTPSPTATPTVTATTTSNPPATSAPVGPAPTLPAPFGMPGPPGMPGNPGGYVPYANPPGGMGEMPQAEPPRPDVDSPPGQKVRYRMYTCTNYEAREGAPAAYHCVPETEAAAENSRYWGFYGQNKDSGSYGVPQGQAYPQGQYQYPTQPYGYSTPGAIAFTDCNQARAAGYSTIQRGAAGYSTTLDRDNDGIACEVGE